MPVLLKPEEESATVTLRAPCQTVTTLQPPSAELSDIAFGQILKVAPRYSNLTSRNWDVPSFGSGVVSGLNCLDLSSALLKSSFIAEEVGKAYSFISLFW